MLIWIAHFRTPAMACLLMQSWKYALVCWWCLMPESRCVTSTVTSFGRALVFVISALTSCTATKEISLYNSDHDHFRWTNESFYCVSVVVQKTYEGVSGKELQWKSAELCCAEHGELTMHAGINKCTGVTADHVKKHLGAVCVCIYAGIFVFLCGRPHPRDHHKIKPINPSYMWVFWSFTKVKNKSDKVTVWSF